MKKDSLKIVLMGLDFNSKNLGCSALGHSFLVALQNTASHLGIQLDLVSVNYASASFKGENYVLRDLPIHIKQKSFRKQFVNEVTDADLVFDFTGGDSFTDIYGLKRFFRETAFKQYVLNKGKPLILGPQTIGPFNKGISRRWAKSIVNKSVRVFTRDSLSYEYSQKTFGTTPFLTTDIAFMLPAENLDASTIIKGRNIGINVSGLMWHGGYTGHNELGISIDYRRLIESYLEYLFDNKWDVWLIPHVLPEDASSPENDYQPMEELKVKFPQINLAPRFKTPMEAKGFISNMDFFVGSRMHATVGAFSMGVPTVSIAYSRKFQGLYNSIDYPYVINAKSASTEQAFNQLVEWTDEHLKLKKNVECSMRIVEKKNKEFVDEIEMLLSEAASGKGIRK